MASISKGLVVSGNEEIPSISKLIFEENKPLYRYEKVAVKYVILIFARFARCSKKSSRLSFAFLRSSKFQGDCTNPR
jgi:hypothetical protein